MDRDIKEDEICFSYVEADDLEETMALDADYLAVLNDGLSEWDSEEDVKTFKFDN